MSGKNGGAEKKPRATEYIDLNLRIRNDGGPMYAFLRGIEDSYARGDRVRQLLYLGMLAERGMVGGAIPSIAVGSPSFPSAAPPVAPTTATKPNEHPAPGENTTFAAEDLMAVFGGSGNVHFGG